MDRDDKKMRDQRNPWTVKEDAKLKSLVSKHGAISRGQISAEMMTGRSSSSCYARWWRHLRPDFTREEDDIIIAALAQHSDNWVAIACLLDHHTGTTVKDRWKALRHRHNDSGSELPPGKQPGTGMSLEEAVWRTVRSICEELLGRCYDTGEGSSSMASEAEVIRFGTHFKAALQNLLVQELNASDASEPEGIQFGTGFKAIPSEAHCA